MGNWMLWNTSRAKKSILNLIIFENITQRRKHQVQAQQNFCRIYVKLVGDTQTMYDNHGLIWGMQLMFAEHINAPIVEHIHQSKSSNESQALLSQKVF